MVSSNLLTLAVAGSRKTQGIIDDCAQSPSTERILVLTYTRVNQNELRSRLAQRVGDRGNIEVMGWFEFLIAHFVRPFLPFSFPGNRIRGFDFESEPQTYASVDNYTRYFNDSAQGRKVHLAQLATKIEEASSGAVLSRLTRLYDHIYIDEVQDLCGYDLEILRVLLKSDCPITMVGDVRQAVMVTNEREKKHKQYMYMGIWKWFQESEQAGLLQITQRAETWRCRPEIASFADSLFESSWGFAATISRNANTTRHDGIFLVLEEHVDAYLATFDPLFLRSTANSARGKPWQFMNFRLSKGMTRERVLIWPTGPIEKFVTSSSPLTERQAAEIYVAVTRAEQSVAFVIDKPKGSTVPYWAPSTSNE